MYCKATGGSKAETSVPVPEIFWVKCKEMQADEFFKTFENAREVVEDDVEYLKMDDATADSITSANMNDCITLFGVNYLKGEIESVSAYHIKSLTDHEEIIDMYLSDFQDSERCDFFIVGGNDASTAKGDLADTIESCISIFFGKKANWAFKQFTNLSKGSGLQYTSANIQKDGTLNYCLHNDLR